MKAIFLYCIFLLTLSDKTFGQIKHLFVLMSSRRGRFARQMDIPLVLRLLFHGDRQAQSAIPAIGETDESITYCQVNVQCKHTDGSETTKHLNISQITLFISIILLVDNEPHYPLQQVLTAAMTMFEL